MAVSCRKCAQTRSEAAGAEQLFDLFGTGGNVLWGIDVRLVVTTLEEMKDDPDLGVTSDAPGHVRLEDWPFERERSGATRSHGSLFREHVAHLPLAALNTPGVALELTGSARSKDGTTTPYQNLVLVDGNHRAELAIRNGRPFQVFVLPAEICLMPTLADGMPHAERPRRGPRRLRPPAHARPA